MNRNYLDEADMLTGDPNYDSGIRRFTKKQADQPRRSPIRRKDKLRQEEGMQPKAKRNYKKIRIKSSMIGKENEPCKIQIN